MYSLLLNNTLIFACSYLIDFNMLTIKSSQRQVLNFCFSPNNKQGTVEHLCTWTFSLNAHKTVKGMTCINDFFRQTKQSGQFLARNFLQLSQQKYSIFLRPTLHVITAISPTTTFKICFIFFEGFTIEPHQFISIPCSFTKALQLMILFCYSLMVAPFCIRFSVIQ